MILFISDLHLGASRPAIAQAFYAFLNERATQADELYILGDLFELWIGDDDDDPFNREVQAKIKACADTGTRIYFMRGNRDFLIGEEFAKKCGLTLLDDPTLIEVDQHRWLLMHGDTLCTNDVDYQAFRTQSRHPDWVQSVLAKTLDERRLLGRQLRQQSKTMASRKAEDIMDVTPDAVESVIKKYSVDAIIHGHTHRPDRHGLFVDGVQKERIVLGDWDKHGWCLNYNTKGEGNGDRGLVLESWPISESR